MAIQTGTGKNPKPPGAPATLKQGTRPAGETYKTDISKTRLARGGLGPVRRDPITGGDTARTGYGQNDWSGASSAGVVESSKLSDLDITVDDPALEKLVRQGVGVKENDAVQEMVGQERPISDEAFPAANPDAKARQPSSKNISAHLPGKVTPNEGEPVRSPITGYNRS